MLSPRSILCPFCPKASRSTALQHALFLANRLQVPLHVTPWPNEGITGRSEMKKVIHSCTTDGASPPSIYTNAWEAASFCMTDWLAYTTKHNIDLIVLATPEDGTAGPILSCQELQPMILRTTAALLTVGHRNGRPPFTRILMPTDMTPEAVPTLHHAEAAASMYDARLDILHVLSRRKYVALTRTDLLALDDAAMAPRTTKRRLRTWYRRNAHPAYTHSISTHVHVEEGDPATAITQAVHTYDSDLIVIAASQNKAREAALSPITENVLRRTTCSVLVTRPQNCHLVSAPASDSNHSAVSST